MNQGGKRNTGPAGYSPFVSIITVVFNSQDLIGKTIESINRQSSQNFELIVVDGGSRDNTLNILRNYSHAIDILISEPDQGIYDAMNKGLRLAKGRYVWFINSGDEIESTDTIKNIELKDQNADIFYGETNYINSSGKVIGTRSELSTRKLPDKLTWKSMKYGMVVSHQSILVKKSICKMYHLEYKCSSDIDWVIDALKKSKIIINCNQILSKYLVGGYSYGNAKKCWKERFKIYLKYYGLINSVLIHILIIIRAAFHRMKGESNY